MQNDKSLNAVLVPLSEGTRFSDFVTSVLPLLRFSSPSITLFHVVEAPITSPLSPESMNGILRRFEDTAKPIAQWFEQQHYKVSIKTAVARSVADAILEETSTGNYAFIFMLKRRRSGLRTRLSRSITKQVSEKSAIPVISVLL